MSFTFSLSIALFFRDWTNRIAIRPMLAVQTPFTGIEVKTYTVVGAGGRGRPKVANARNDQQSCRRSLTCTESRKVYACAIKRPSFSFVGRIPIRVTTGTTISNVIAQVSRRYTEPGRTRIVDSLLRRRSHVCC